jgi:hypothetical protein
MTDLLDVVLREDGGGPPYGPEVEAAVGLARLGHLANDKPNLYQY